MKNRSAQRGLTLVELMVIVGIGLIVISIAVIFGIKLLNSAQEESAETQAREFGQRMGMKVKNVSCMSADANGDGYVSCTILHEEQDGRLARDAVKCASKISFNKGCKLAVLPMQPR